jgi:hypothetical protein
MGAFGVFLRDLFQNFITAIVSREASKTVVITAAFTALLAFLAGLAVALFTVIQTALQTIVYQVQTPELVTFIGVFWPPHYSLCLAVCISARITRWIYDRSIMAAELYWSALAR